MWDILCLVIAMLGLAADIAQFTSLFGSDPPMIIFVLAVLLVIVCVAARRRTEGAGRLVAGILVGMNHQQAQVRRVRR